MPESQEPECTDPSVGQKLKLWFLEEIYVNELEEQNRLWDHAEHCESCWAWLNTFPNAGFAGH